MTKLFMIGTENFMKGRTMKRNERIYEDIMRIFFLAPFAVRDGRKSGGDYMYDLQRF